MPKPTTLRAYEVEYRVKVIAYGRTAEEAHRNGETVFTMGNGECEILANDYLDDPEGYAKMVARVGDRQKVGRPRRRRDEDVEMMDEGMSDS